MGRLYLIEHCVYVYNAKQERKLYEIYVTDRLKAINDSLASFYGGSTTKDRYVDLFESMRNVVPDDSRTAEQVISSISDKLERLGKDEPI